MPTAAHLSTTARKRSNTPSMRPAANSTASSVINAEPASYPQISQTRQLSTPSEPFGREILLLARRRFGDSAEFCQNFLLAEDQVLLIIDLDLTAGVFAEQDPVTHLHVERDTAFLFHLSGSDGHYFALLRFFFSRIGDDDPTLRGLLFFQPPHKHAVMQGSDIHSHFFNLRLIHSKDSNSKLVLILDNTTGEKSFDSSVALLRGHRFLFSGGPFPSADPLDSPALWIWQSQHRLVHPAVSKT